jgi:ligand-binding SRPBCC domain-containing protein
MHNLRQEQFLPITLDKAWAFFSSPKNLNEVTPEDMVFEITSDMPDLMYEGMMITYRIKPMLNISMNWCTEITHINNHHFFIDEQRKGPYNIWHHEHHFKEVKGGILMTDILYYDIGKSFLGWIAGHLLVHKKVKQIFEFRYKKLEQIFSKEK